MRLYDNAPASYHDELKSFYPEWYASVAEMDAIWQVTGEMLDEAKTDILRVINNVFVGECDMETVERLEKYLNIGFDSPRTNDERQRFLKMQFAGFGKCSASRIKEMVRKYTGADTQVSFSPSDEAGNHALYINVDRGDSERFYLSDVLTMLEKMIPAHIEYSMSVVRKTRITASMKMQHWIFDYEQAGTKPDSALVSSRLRVSENFNTSVVQGMISHTPAGTTVTTANSADNP